MLQRVSFIFLVAEVDDFESSWILHPDPNVDLAAFIVGPLINQLNHNGKNIHFIKLPLDLISSHDERKTFSPMEDIIMIGYPNGIWDSKNNLPVIRKGITATHCGIDWNGKPEFLTDIASFPGSSGSPVLLANMNGFTDNKGTAFLGQKRIRLIGILYAGTQHTATGSIEIITAPTSSMPVPITTIPNNIGIVINSNELYKLQKQVQLFIKANS